MNVPQMLREAFEATEEVGNVPVSGDWHGQTGWAKHAINLMARASHSPVQLHLGDFGFWPGGSGQKYLTRVNKILVRTHRFLGVTPGNHEDYRQLSQFHRSDDFPGVSWNPDYPRIFVFDRGHRWVWRNLTFLSVGGANSIPHSSREENRDWWSGEQISWDDVNAAKAGGAVDVMLSHDAPTGIKVGASHRTELDLPPSAWRYMNDSREKLRVVTDAVQPRYLFHGHYHKWLAHNTQLHAPYKGSYTIQSQGLNMDYTAENLGVFDMEQETFTRILTPVVSWKIPFAYSRETPQWDDVEPVQYM